MCPPPTPSEQEFETRLAMASLRLVGDQDYATASPQKIQALCKATFQCGEEKCSQSDGNQERLSCGSSDGDSSYGSTDNSSGCNSMRDRRGSMRSSCNSMRDRRGSIASSCASVGWNCGCHCGSTGSFCGSTDDYESERSHPKTDVEGAYHSTVTPLYPGYPLYEPCLCPNCQSELYELALHPQDHQPFHRNVPLGIWKHNDYHLAKLAVESFALKSDHPRVFAQLRAQDQWKQYWSLLSNDSNLLASPRLARMDSRTVLQKPVEIFNQLFFLGQLPASQIGLHWITQEHYSIDIKYLRGYTRFSHDIANIEINPLHALHIGKPAAILNTLIHEMAHAFLGRYACYPPLNDCTIPACHALMRQNHGIEHGRAWQVLAKGIEDFGPWWLPGMKVDLGRCGQVIGEITYGGFVPSCCDARELMLPTIRYLVVY